jgi:MFS family permease
MSAQPTRLKPALEQTEAPYPPIGYAWYVVCILTVVYIFSFIDRQILSLLIGPIRRDLHISDTQVSVLQGFIFAVFYTFFGIPLGRLADIRSRRSLIAAGLALWSFFSAGCGLARNFVQMLFLRMGVGVGEASLSPSAYSLITDYFPKERLATAISFYSMGIYIGSGMAFLLGGVVVRLASVKEAWIFPLVGAVRPWQVIFFVVGLPGLLFALLLYTVREPLRRGLAANAVRVPMREVFAYIFRNKTTFLSHNIGFGLLSLVSYSAAAWVPEYFRRVHHWDIPTIGVVYGSIVAIFGSLGILSAGYVADWLRGRDVLNANMRVGAIIGVLWIPVHFFLFLAPTGVWAAVWLVPAAICAGAPFGIAPAAIQQMMPNTMRGQAGAVYLFILNLIGLGIGPTAVGATTQYFFKHDDAVNYSLLIVNVAGSVSGALTLWLGSKPFLKSLDRLREWAAEN